MKYVGGTFTQAGDQAVNNIATLNTNDAWEAFGTNESDGPINSIAIAPDSKIFIAGEFTTVDGVNASNIAFWNGTSWNPLGAGTNGLISKIKFNINGVLFV